MKNTNLLVGITNSGKTKMIFDYLKEIINSGENFIVNDSAGKDVIESGRKLTGFTYEEQITIKHLCQL